MKSSFARRACGMGVVLSLAAFAPSLLAESLGSGTISPTSGPITFAGGPYESSNPTIATSDPIGIPAGEWPLGLQCDDSFRCDDFELTVDIPADWFATHSLDQLQLSVSWDDPAAAAGASANDIDIFLYDASGADVGGSTGATSANPEVIVRPLTAGVTTYRLRVVPYAVTPGKTISGRIALLASAAPPPPPPGANASIGGPNFFNYAPPAPPGNADEPTMGVNLANNDAYLLFSLDVMRAQFDDSSSPAAATWSNIGTGDAFTTADPFMATDAHRIAGAANPRVWIAQLLSATSYIAYTDDNGASWTMSAGPGQVHGVDNQSIAAGPYPAGFTPGPVPASYPHAVYYCSHEAVNAFCSRSDDGGATFNASRPIFPLDGLCNNHGHVKVGGDGTVYVPMNNSCQGAEGVTLSTDGGETWHYVTVPNTVEGRWDSSIAIANDGKTVYYGYAEFGDDRPRIIKGVLNKSNPANPVIDWDPNGASDVGAPFGLVNIAFSTVVAGDPDRAAFAFHGTTVGGDSGDLDHMQGAKAVWHLYVATTYDGGATWQVRNVTPGRPTQKGSICDNGTTCPTSPNDRNLLDFMGMAIDGEGRILVGYADGCTGSCNVDEYGSGPNFAAAGVIARQVDGKRMLAAFDPAPPGPLPGKAPLTGVRTDFAVTLDWETPTSGTSPITGYLVQRSVDGGAFARIGETEAGITKFTDRAALVRSKAFSYRVAAINANGTGPFSNPVTPLLPEETVCTGIRLLTDSADDVFMQPQADVPQDPGPFDVRNLTLLQPYYAGGEYKFVFKLKVKDLSTLPPNTTWPVDFNIQGRTIVTSTNTVTGAVSEVPHYRVHMHTQGGAVTPAFEVIRNPASNANAAYGTRLVTPIEGSFDPGGMITLTVNAASLGLSAPGTDKLIKFLTRIAFNAQAGTVTPDNMPNDLTAAGTFATADARYCSTEPEPTAAILASATTGFAPLTVSFDASGSQTADPRDSLVNYVFDFGDGSAEYASTTPTASYTYANPGAYGMKLTVQDSRGRVSTNPAQLQVVVDENTVPAPFTFATRTGRLTASWVGSGTVTIAGLSSVAPVSVSNGQYRINGGAFTNQPGTIATGDTLAVRHRTSSDPSTATDTVVSVGSYSTTFRTVTGTADRTPSDFTFYTVIKVDPATVVESNAFTPTGFNSAAPVTVTGGEYRVNGGAWTTAAGTLLPGQTLQLRHTSSATPQGTARSVAHVGGMVAAFMTRTKP